MENRTDSDGQIGLLGAVAIGVGGMVGGGIFAVLGLAAVLEGLYILFLKEEGRLERIHGT